MRIFAQIVATLSSFLAELDTVERRSLWHGFFVGLRHLRPHPKCEQEHNLEHFLVGYIGGWAAKIGILYHAPELLPYVAILTG